MSDETPSRMANKPVIPSEGTPSHTHPPECHIPAGASRESSDFFSRTAADDQPATMPLGLSETFRHGGWMPFRRKVEQALLSTPGITPRRIAAFRLCGADAFVEGRACNPALPSIKEFRIRQTKCHDRFCVPCSTERGNRIRHALLNHMRPKKDLKLVTLTLAASSAPLSEVLDRITRHFRTLRNKPLWKKHVMGGVAIIETKLGKNSGAWHVHFHVVCEAKYIPQRDLSELWLAITGDSRIVDIRAVGARTGAVSYITKYVTKAADHSVVMSPKHLSEAITAFHGRRLVTTFAGWRGLELLEKPNEDTEYFYDSATQMRWPKDPWRPLGRLDDVIAAAAAGDAAALYIMRKIRRGPRPPPPGEV